ncbi:MAG: crotonase/enoyl-CoA hydratase family protein [Polyangiaceae bacterium]|nr:crotonase/enoyl-CoA hydratase family protein [Polyangiaceae bacterium]
MRQSAMPETLRIEGNEHVVSVVLQKPTMPPLFFDELGAAFDEISARADVRAVIVRSDCKHFTYGLDLPAAFAELGPSLQGGTAAVRLELNRTILRLQAQITKVASCPVPVIAAVHGWCIGGGVDLITACDMRLCTSDARFSVRETKIAIVADIGTLQRLPLVVGKGQARELAFTGKDIDAERAERIGLVNQVFADPAALRSGAEALAHEIAANAPLTVRGVKRVMDFGEGRSVAEGLEFVAAWNSAFLASEDLGEALAAFLEKRPPSFQGR